MRIIIALVGITLMVVSFLMHSYKKITVNYTVMWELLGIVLILIGIVPVFSDWTNRLATGTGLAFFWRRRYFPGRGGPLQRNDFTASSKNPGDGHAYNHA